MLQTRECFTFTISSPWPTRGTVAAVINFHFQFTASRLASISSNDFFPKPRVQLGSSCSVAPKSTAAGLQRAKERNGNPSHPTPANGDGCSRLFLMTSCGYALLWQRRRKDEEKGAKRKTTSNRQVTACVMIRYHKSFGDSLGLGHCSPCRFR